MTNVIYQSQQESFDYNLGFTTWTQRFLALTWASAGFMCFATLVKAFEVVVQKLSVRDESG